MFTKGLENLRTILTVQFIAAYVVRLAQIDDLLHAHFAVVELLGVIVAKLIRVVIVEFGNLFDGVSVFFTVFISEMFVFHPVTVLHLDVIRVALETSMLIVVGMILYHVQEGFVLAHELDE